MTFSADDWLTVVEALALLFGIGITWALYRRPPVGIPGEPVEVGG